MSDQQISSSPAAASAARSALLLVAAVVVAGAVNTVVALAARAAGASEALQALTPPAYVVLGAVGILVGFAGWRAVRRVAQRPRRVLARLVPVVVVVSWVPDVLAAVTGSLPGIDAVGAVGLMVMHVTTAAVAVPVFQRIAPVH